MVNVETFVSKWWSTSISHLPLEVEEWIEKSYSDPEIFWKDVIFPEQESLLPSSQSIFGKSYNFYHDCVIRYIKSNKIAFSIVHEDEVDHWSYERLHQCVNYHVDKWSYHSPQQDQLMVIVASPGIHLYISLLTALRFGLKICYLPTNSPYLGKGLILDFIEELKPHLIAAEDPSFAVEGIPTLTVNERGMDEENYNPTSFAYPAATELLMTLPLYDTESFTVTSIDAHTLYFHLLRDGLITLNLLQHPYWAAPLACPIRTEPCSTLMTLLCGTTRVYVPDELIRKNPLILQHERVSLLGISNELQKLWSHVSGIPLRYLKTYYKSPLDVDFQAWKPFMQTNRLEKIPSMQLLIDSSLGGISLFSKPCLDLFYPYLKPTLGTSWSLLQINGSGEPSLNGFGMFSPYFASNEGKEGNLMSTQTEKHLMMTGFLEPCREGVIFPAMEVEVVVNNISFVEASLVHSLPKTGMVFSRYFVLLVFVSPMKQEISDEDRKRWSGEIEKEIEDQLGRGYLPDHIEYYPLLPRMIGEEIDRRWCSSQYQSGLLAKKQKLKLYQTLSLMKKLIKSLVDA